MLTTGSRSWDPEPAALFSANLCGSGSATLHSIYIHRFVLCCLPAVLTYTVRVHLGCHPALQTTVLYVFFHVTSVSTEYAPRLSSCRTCRQLHCVSMHLGCHPALQTTPLRVLCLVIHSEHAPGCHPAVQTTPLCALLCLVIHTDTVSIHQGCHPVVQTT